VILFVAKNLAHLRHQMPLPKELLPTVNWNFPMLWSPGTARVLRRYALSTKIAGPGYSRVDAKSLPGHR
jgi:hypothetical protein